jgi:hypothetical protein
MTTSVSGAFADEDTRSSLIPDKFKGTTVHAHEALDDAIEETEMFERMREVSTGKPKA